MQRLKEVFFIIISFSIITNCTNNSLAIKEEKDKIDSVSVYLSYYKKKNKTISEKKYFLERVVSYLSKEKNDTTKAKLLSNIAYKFYQLKDTINFLRINSKAQNLAYKTNHFFSIADTHWSLGEYYNKKNNFHKAYFHHYEALKNFQKTNFLRECAMVRRDMAGIRIRFKDYINAENLIFKSIKDFKKLNDSRQLFNCYTSLGILANSINEYDKALEYYQKALKFLKKVKNKRYYLEQTLNNIGYTYFEKKEYNLALNYFKKALKLVKPLYLRAMIISNIAETNLHLNNIKNVEDDFLLALKINDSLDIKKSIINSKLCLVKYYRYINDSIKMKSYAEEAFQLANYIKDSNLYLKSLKTLSQIYEKNSKKCLERYIQFNDSIITVERQAQNKFTRIEFETDEFKEETERLSKQQIYISSISIIAFLIFGFVYFIRIQKNKNEKLVLEAAQQRATEEVYLLTLQQQTKLEKEKAEERNRISRELHDGILGKLFGTRVGLGFLEISDDETTQEQHQNFLDELQDIEKEIRDVSHQLHSNFDSAAVNFTKLVTTLLNEKSTIGSFKHQLFIDKNVSWDKIDEIIKISIYRIIQESLQNIIKHANATNVMVNFMQKTNVLEIEIKDDGIGFDSSKKKKGIGLKNIEARLRKVNGSLQINSAKNEGTELKILIPIG